MATQVCFVISANRRQKARAAPKSESAGKSRKWRPFRICLVYALKGLSLYALEGRKVGVNDQQGQRIHRASAFFHPHQCGFRSGAFC